MEYFALWGCYGTMTIFLLTSQSKVHEIDIPYMPIGLMWAKGLQFLASQSKVHEIDVASCTPIGLLWANDHILLAYKSKVHEIERGVFA
jgi:hypothetical protein